MSLETELEELRAHVSLQAGSSTLLLVVVPSDASIEGARRVLLELLRATPMEVADLGASTSSMGPARWAELTRAQAGAPTGAYVLSFVPVTALEARSFAILLNAERQHMRQLAGPMLLVISSKTEQALRTHAYDFYTWAARSFALPEARELAAMATKLGVRLTEPAAPIEAPIRFLHVSDFHLRAAKVARYEQDRVLDGLVQFLERDREGFPLDLVFVTGDLAFSGQADELAQVVVVLRRLLEVTGVPPDRMFVVPGNHDVDRDVGRWLLRTLASDKQAIAFFEEPDGRTFHRKKLEAYEASLRELFGSERTLGLGVGAEAVELVEVAGTRLAVASFNSSWFAQGDDDQGNLWLGEPNVRHAVDRIADADAVFAISLLHHPFEYLHEAERELVERWFERGFDLVLRGHLHKDKTRSIASQRGGYVEVAAPAAYQGSQWPNGCFLGEIRPKARTVRLRPYAYAAGPDPWVLDTKVFPDDEGDGYCRTFTIPKKVRRKSSMAAAARMAVKGAYERASPYQKMQVKRQVLGDRANVASQHADDEVIQQLAEEAPELRKKILGNVDRNVALVSAIESEGVSTSHPHIDIDTDEGFGLALVRAGRLFLQHTFKLGLDRGRMASRDAKVGFAASLGAVTDLPVMVDSWHGGRHYGDIIIKNTDGQQVHAILDVVSLADQRISSMSAVSRLGERCRDLEVRHAAVVIVGFLPGPIVTEPGVTRITAGKDRGLWMVNV